MAKSFSNLNVILVEPNGSLNVGSIARLCANFEVNELRIVSPKCNIFSVEAKKMAMKGQSYINECKIFNSLEKALIDCDLVVASCGRIDKSKDIFFESPIDISKWLSTFVEVKNLAILFGREDRGLTNQELLLAHKIFSIPTSKDYPSLNLSHAVSITLYELNRFSERNSHNDLKELNFAKTSQIKESFLEIEEMLIRVGYLLKQTSTSKIIKFKRYILRANTSIHELNILRGIVHQINWFINNSKNK